METKFWNIAQKKKKKFRHLYEVAVKDLNDFTMQYLETQTIHNSVSWLFLLTLQKNLSCP